MRSLVILFLVVFSGLQVHAGIEQFSARKSGGTDLVVSPTVPLLRVYDDRYNEMFSNPSWSSNYTIKSVKNRVRLGINPAVAQTNDLIGNITVQIKMWKWVSGSFTMSTTTQTLSLNYVHATPTGSAIDLQTYAFSDAHRVEVYLIAMDASLDKEDIYISSEIEVDRNYTLTPGMVTGLSVDASDANYYEFNWDQKVGAEGYELEWVHVSDVTMTSNPNTLGGTYLTTGQLSYDYYLNSTRVFVLGNTWRIPKVFNSGYIVYRIRPIGYIGNTTVRNEGDWTNVESGLIALHVGANVINVVGDYDPNMNWSHQVSYDDKGNRFEGISYADGLGRGRQQVGHNTATKQAVVSNVYYDELGRGVIADLPTPVDGEDLHHKPNFNAFQTDNSPSGIDYKDFDAATTTACNTVTAPFSNASGAGKYYSSANTTQDGANKRIPDAEKYPYSRAYYMNDFTGRLEKTAGVGGTLRGGNGHDSWFYYPTPNQAELDGLFGAEVGQASHYEKMVTVDANGQAYIQYSDMAGRVIASYLAGDAPSSLSPIDGNGGVTATTNILPQNQQHIDWSVPSSTLTYNEYFTTSGNYTINYAFTPAQFHNACMTENFCMDCVYDMTLSVVEECSGTVKYSNTITLAGEDVGNVCAADAEESFTSPAFYLDKGLYQIVKKLSLHEQIIQDNWCVYSAQSTCLTPLSELFNPAYAAEPFENCIDEITEQETDDCTFYRAQMLADMTPGGQYAGYINTSGSYSPYIGGSTIHSVLTEDALGANMDWKHPRKADDSGYDHYKEADGVTDAMIDGNYAEYASFQRFIESFQPSWANALLPYHPEYCFLKFCESDLTASNNYDREMLNTYDYATACSEGYFAPFTGCDVTPIPCTATGTDPYFSTHGTDIPQMLSLMNNYMSSGHSAWEEAVYQAYCGGTGDFSSCISAFSDSSNTDQGCYLDLVWINYRSIYLQLKNIVTYGAQTKICNNTQIGSGDWSNQHALWGNSNMLAGFDANMDGSISASEAQTTLETYSASACQSACQQYANDWVAQLAGCEQYWALSAMDSVQFYNDLVTLCMSGCDTAHPAGSTTAPPGYGGTYSTIDEILAHYFGSGYEDELCTSLLISEPGPYISNGALDSMLVHPLDTCGCRAIEQANYDLTHNNPLGYNLEQMLAHNTGIELQDANYLLCECDKFVEGAYDPNDPNPWVANANTNLMNQDLEVPATLSCTEGSGCVDCAVIDSLMNLLEDRFDDVDDFENTQTYTTIVTNYLNNSLNFHLTYPDYLSYINKCHATSGSPYCYTNPVLNEWAEVMTLVSYQGKIITPSGTPVNLLTGNIVFANSQLQDELNGHQYWSSLSGNVLTTTFGSTEENCSITLTLPDNAGFTFKDIIRFGMIQPVSTNCSENNGFTVMVSYLSCGEVKTAELTGTSSCLRATICYCSETTELLCDKLPSYDDGKTCYQPRLDELYQNALEQYLSNVADAYTAYETEYRSDCAAAFSTEKLSYTGMRNNYHYTLFFYDQAGNLARTVAPLGIPSSFNTANVTAARNSVVDFSTYNPLSMYSSAPPFPGNSYETKYEYNSYNQLVSTTNPDQLDPVNPSLTGKTNYWYDYYGRIVASQNPVQAIEFKYSYILYDKYGRPVETGQIDQQVPQKGGGMISILPISEATIKSDDKGAGFQAWVYSGTRTEVTYTVYDNAMSPAVTAKFETAPKNLRLRVASVVYFDAVSSSVMPLTGYASAIHYSYDEHGNVLENLQDVPALAPVKQDVKSTRYEFELLSGNVKKVKYQEKEYNQTTAVWEAGRDRITHEYVYDVLNRLTEVFSTKDAGVHKNREAHYRYFDYGPMARVEIGEYKVQANDFSYTINGWIKGMNSSSLQPATDPARDGASGLTSGYYANNLMAHDLVAKDLVGYTIGYFQGDYKGINTTAANFEADPYSGSNPMAAAIKSLYNGNISHSVTSVSGLTNQTQAGVYVYDQLQRLKSMDVYRGINTSANNWTAATHTDDYKSTYSYDKNGNLKSLFRNGFVSSGPPATVLGMDDLSYNYVSGTNKLSYVSDVSATDGNYTDDINSGQSAGNYKYDEIGQLLSDNQEGITSLVWRFGDKKLQSEQGPNTALEFIYNPFGQRVVKITKSVLGNTIVKQSSDYSWLYTYYAYDANGQVMATYDVMMNSFASTQKATLNEQLLYGASRLGVVSAQKVVYNNAYTALEDPVFTNETGKKRYELTNYLGNVNAVITDRKIVTQNTQLNDINTFDSGLTGWAASSGTPTVSGSQLNMTQTGSTIYVFENYSTTVGEDYVVSITPIQGTTSGLSTVINGVTYALVSGVTNNFRFTATSTTTSVRVKPTTGSGTYTYYLQDVTIRQRAKYNAVALMQADYYPFGMEMPGRNNNIDKYRYGYNGMELDNEVKGNGKSYTTEFRQYDPRLGRWMSLDPLMAEFPWMSPYVAFNDNPVYYTDPLGLKGGPAVEYMYGAVDTEYEKKVVLDLENVTDYQTQSFRYDQGGDQYLFRTYTYFNKKWTVTEKSMTRTGGQDTHNNEHRKPLDDIDASLKNLSVPSITKPASAVSNSVSRAKDVTGISSGISKGDPYRVNGTGGTSDLYTKNGERLLNQTGTIKNGTAGKQMFKTLDAVDKYLGPIGTAAEVIDIGQDIANHEWGSAAEKTALATADMIADRLLMIPTPVTVATGALIKITVVAWDYFPIPKPVSTPPKSKPIGGLNIDIDSMDPVNVIPYNIRNLNLYYNVLSVQRLTFR
ncbi:RHS repeat-associated core domain-containing protein [Fluviicola sp.]|uniref:RHS repeat-associated core domain-containing protein n=1 Tax=Fluviicola sp. TaxID=1917219 RepID=UPI0031D32911